MTLLITICGLIELTFGDKTFKMGNSVPKFFSNRQDKMASPYGSAHFWPFFIYLIFQIPFHIFLYIRYRKEKIPKDPLLQKNTSQNTPHRYNMQSCPTDPYYNSSDFNYIPQPQRNDYAPPPINSNGYQSYSQTPF